MRRVLPLLLTLALTDLATAPAAQAQVRRCELPTGQTIYTDRTCESIDAVEQRESPSQPQLRSYRPACARGLRDLYFDVSAAIESQDVNRLASVYHWAGMSNRQGYDVMRRLQDIVDRPLVDLQPIYPGGDDTYAPGRAPVGFRVEQVAVRSATPVRAVLGLRKHLDCWWITLGGVARPRPAQPVLVESPPPAAVEGTVAPVTPVTPVAPVAPAPPVP